MKKLILIINIVVIAIVNLQVQDTMYIYRKTNPLLKVPVSDIDSVIFYKPTMANEASQNTVTDIDGNVYNIITIGGQVWMKENLKVTKLKDGTAIPLVTSTVQWATSTTPSYCYYNNSTVTGVTYGALYNWYTVNTNKLCPSSWHVPSNSEWSILSNFLGGDYVSGGKLKITGTIYWKSFNSDATNETGFSALGSGVRFSNGIDSGIFSDFLHWAYW
jgi:uncharacterized protein (TIGR02145 family)